MVCFGDQGGQLLDEADRVLLEEVRESIDDLVQLIHIYRRKNRMVRVMTSTLFRRRQEELEAGINLAVNRLQARDQNVLGVGGYGDRWWQAFIRDVGGALRASAKEQ